MKGGANSYSMMLKHGGMEGGSGGNSPRGNFELSIIVNAFLAQFLAIIIITVSKI